MTKLAMDTGGLREHPQGGRKGIRKRSRPQTVPHRTVRGLETLHTLPCWTEPGEALLPRRGGTWSQFQEEAQGPVAEENSKRV